MSNFCTSCGAANSGSGFCTSCGASIGATAQTAVSTPAPTPAPAPTPVTETAWSNPDESVLAGTSSSELASGSDSSRKTILAIVATVVLFIGTGVGAFLAGKSSVDIEAERKTGYDSGFSAGESSGFDRGDSAGYDRGFSAGKTAGCRDVFSFTDGTFDYMIPYDPFSSFDKYPGGYYTERTDC